MNYKTTAVLVVLAALVAAYFIFVERESETTDEREQRRAETAQTDGEALFSADELSTEQVRRVKIERGDKIFAMAKEDDQWVQTEPVSFSLNKWSADGLVDDAAGLRYVEKFIPGDDGSPSLAQMRLDPPLAVVTLESDKATHVARLGKKTLGGHAYVMVGEDESVYVVKDDLHEKVLDKKPSEWRKKSFDMPKVEKADRVLLHRGGQAIELVKVDGRWFLDSQATERADAKEVDELIGVSPSISDFVDDEPEDLSIYGLASPQIELVVHTPAIEPPPDTPDNETADGQDDSPDADDEPNAGEPARVYTLRIGSGADLENEKFFATWSSAEADAADELSRVVFTLNKYGLDRLEVSADDLRDPRIVTAKASEVRELKIERTERQTIHLVRDPEGAITFGEPQPGFAADYDAATTLFDAIVKAEADTYLPEPPTGVAPVASINLSLRGSGLTESATIYPAGEEPKTYAVVRGGETVVYEVEADTLETVFKPLIHLRDKSLIKLGEEQIAQLTLKRDDGFNFTFLSDREVPAEEPEAATTQPADAPAPQTQPGIVTWNLEGSERYEVLAIDGLVRALAYLQVEQWLTEPVMPQPNWAELTIEVVDGSPLVLRVDPQTRRGTLSGTDAPFTLGESFVDRLAAEYRDRTAVDLTIDQIESVTISRDQASMTIRRDADDRYVSEAGDDLDQEEAAGVFDTLAGLRVERYTAPQGELSSSARIVATTTDGKTIEIGLNPDRKLAEIPGAIGWCHLSDTDLKKLLGPIEDDDENEPDEEDMDM